MQRIRYFQLDVFTGEPFAGNQLAVFFDAQLTDAQMQTIAREMNFSESVFIVPPTNPSATARLRIFTPQVELPFAGHPTIGATFALAGAGRIGPDAPSPITLETNAGPLSIDLLFEGGRLSFAWMSQPLPTFETWSGDRAALAASLGLAESDLHPTLPIERGSAGVPFVYIPLASESALDRSRPGPELGPALGDPQSHPGAYLFALPAEASDRAFSTRMFAPDMGVAEDPATGSAAGPFGVYLTRHGLTAVEDGVARASVAQGVRMGRPSHLRVAIEQHAGQVTRVRVGGEAVTVAQGDFFAPDNGAAPEPA